MTNDTQTGPEQLKRRILDAAKTVVGEEGITDALIPEIAGRARLTESDIFAVYPTREDLLFAVAEDLFSHFRIDSANVFDESLSLRQRVINMVEHAVKVARYERDALRAVSILINEERALQGVRHPIAEMVRNVRRPVAAIVKRAGAAGEIKPIDPTVFFEFLSGTTVGLHAYLRHHRKGYNPEPMYRALRIAGLALIGLDEDGELIHPEKG